LQAALAGGLATWASPGIALATSTARKIPRIKLVFRMFFSIPVFHEFMDFISSWLLLYDLLSVFCISTRKLVEILSEMYMMSRSG
jgi:hypothetical protein